MSRDTSLVHVAAPLASVSLDDAAGLLALAAEQRARLAIVTTLRHWEWLGGVPSVTLSWVALGGVIAFLVLAPVSLLVASFHQGAWLLGLAILTAIAPLPFWCWVLPRRALQQRQLLRSQLLPCAVIAAEDSYRDPASEKMCGMLVVIEPDGDGTKLRELLAAARTLRALRTGGDVPAEAAACAALLRRDLAHPDGHRLPIPASLVGRTGYELVLLDQRWQLPVAIRGSDLLFVLVDRTRRSAGSTRSVSELLWGDAGQDLAASLVERRA